MKRKCGATFPFTPGGRVQREVRKPSHYFVKNKLQAASIIAALSAALAGTDLTALASLATGQTVPTIRTELVGDSLEAPQQAPEDERNANSTHRSHGGSNSAQASLVRWIREQIVSSVFHASPKTRNHFISIYYVCLHYIALGRL